MENTQQLEMLKKTKIQRFGINFVNFFKSIPGKFKKLGLGIWKFLKKFFWGIVNWFKDIGLTFWHGDWKTKVSYFIMGFGSIFRGSISSGKTFLPFLAMMTFFFLPVMMQKPSSSIYPKSPV